MSISQEDDLIELPKTEVDELLDVNEKVSLTSAEENLFVSLLSVGIKTKEISFFGHTATISTLTTEEEIQLGVPVAKYQSLPTTSHAYRAAVVAASLRDVDGEPLYTPLVAKKESVADQIKQKFEVVIKWSPIIVGHLYDEQAKFTEDLKALWTKLGKE